MQVVRVKTSVVLELTHDEMRIITSALGYACGAKVKIDRLETAELNAHLLQMRVDYEEQLHQTTIAALERARALAEQGEE